MKKNLFLMLIVSSLYLIMATLGFAQDDKTLSSAAGDLYIISAKAGVVNYVEGRVSVNRSGGESGYMVKGDMLEVGDKVSTGAYSRAEVLLNPGSFIRLDRNSEFEFTTTNLDNLKLKVNRGSAIFEVYASNDFKVTVNTPKAKFYLIDTGVYRVNVIGDGVGNLEVHKGKAQVGTTSADILKKGKTATVNDNEVAINKFNRGNLDGFEMWSKTRAKLIAKSNKRLVRDNLENSLLSRNGVNRVNCFGSMGLWVRNRYTSSYSFLPFGYGWRSPYGYGLRTNTTICDPAYRYGYPTYRRTPRRTTSGNDVPVENERRARRNRTPPFRRMERSRNVRRQRSARGSFPTSTGGRTTRRTRPNRTSPTKRTTPVRRTSPRRTSPVLVRPSGKGKID